MGKIDLLNIKQFEKNEFAKEKFKFILTDEELGKVFEIVSQNTNMGEKRYSSYIYGYGGLDELVYKDLKEKESNQYEVLWFGYNGPKLKTLKGLFIRILSSIFSSTYGLIKIKDASITKDVMNVLANLSMVGFFSLSQEHENEFENEFIKNLNNTYYTPEEGAKFDPSFFYFIVDAGSLDKDGNGYLCQCAYGKDCPKELLKIEDFTAKEWRPFLKLIRI